MSMVIPSRTEIDQSLTREECVDVTARDGKRIFVIRNYASSTPSEKVVVIAHGLGGSPTGYMHQMASRFFTDHGYDVIRLAFYWDSHPDYRRLHQTTLELQANDLNDVIAELCGDYKKTYVCGHSYGGLTLVLANPKADAFAFWDNSYQPSERLWAANTSLSADQETHLLHWEYWITIGKAMYDEGRNFTREKATSFAKQIKTRSKIFVAGESWLSEDTRMLYEDLDCPKEIETIKGAGHTFVEGLIVYDLLTKTLEWLEQE